MDFIYRNCFHHKRYIVNRKTIAYCYPTHKILQTENKHQNKETQYVWIATNYSTNIIIRSTNLISNIRRHKQFCLLNLQLYFQDIVFYSLLTKKSLHTMLLNETRTQQIGRKSSAHSVKNKPNTRFIYWNKNTIYAFDKINENRHVFFFTCMECPYYLLA